jgi:hypothetical protein
MFIDPPYLYSSSPTIVTRPGLASHTDHFVSEARRKSESGFELYCFGRVDGVDVWFDDCYSSFNCVEVEF